MDEDRIERALREGPPGEPRYVPARSARGVEDLPSSLTRARQSRTQASGWVRVFATALVAVLVVVVLLVIRSGSPSREPIPVASAPPAPVAPSAALAPTVEPSLSPAPTSPTPSPLASSSPPKTSTLPASPTATGVSGNAAAVAVGVYHTCALTRAGGVKCWGFNSVGQLGDGSNLGSASPVDVVGLTHGVRAIAAASLNTCALTAGGGVQCWGSDAWGQLGDGAYANSSVPVDVAGLTTGIVAISVGDGHTCVITTGGAVKCWGGYCGCEGIGVLGNGSDTSSATPVDVTGLTSGVTALAAGKNHTCALKGDGSVVCWGDNGQGQLGDGTTTARTIPVRVMGLAANVTAIAAGGDRSCAIAAGTVVCWGASAIRSVGSAGTTSSSRPVPASGLPAGIVRLAMGTNGSCVIDAAGSATCWGANTYGQLGDGSRSDRVAPVPVSGLAGLSSSIAPGENHTCAVTTGGAVECWGSNSLGQSGPGVAKGTGSPTPVVIPGL
jgi:alpha-tubulin suppressor-like RCC1 family protein